MAIPDYQTIMKPLLVYLNENEGSQKMQDVIENMIEHFSLSEEEKDTLLPSGQQNIIDNRVGWARTYLKKVGLVKDPKRGYVEITEEGKKVLKLNHEVINTKFLKQFDSFQEFQKKQKKDLSTPEESIEEIDESISPIEMIENGILQINSDIADELMTKIANNSPAFFEKIVLDLLTEMGYGEGKVTGKSGDGGIDGYINQDALGIEKIYFQAKRFLGETKVTSSMVRDFVGSLEFKGVSKGVFITTSDFPKNTEEELEKTQKRIVLINQKKLLNLLIQYNIGVSLEKNYQIKRIDSDYFPVD